MALAGLGWLAQADVAALPVPAQAQCLRGLEVALSVHTAARASVLAAFTAQRGYEADGQGSPRTWLTWQTRVTAAAAGAALASARRLPPTRRSPRRWPAGRCRRRGGGRSASGPMPCPRSAGATRT